MKEQLLQLFLTYGVPLLSVALFALVAWLLVKLRAWLHEKEQTSLAARFASQVADYAASVVAELNATLRPQLVAALADGKLTDVEKSALKSAALDALKKGLPAPVTAWMAATFGAGVETWLAGHLERAVLAQKPSLVLVPGLPPSVPLLPALDLPKASP